MSMRDPEDCQIVCVRSTGLRGAYRQGPSDVRSLVEVHAERVTCMQSV